MSFAREKTVDRAVEHALREARDSVRVVRAAKIQVTLPARLTEDEAGLGARLAIVDRRTLDASLEQLTRDAPPDICVVVVTPLSRGGGSGLAQSLWASVRRLERVELEECSGAFRRAGLVEVRVLHVDGVLGLAVFSGRTTLA